MPVCSEVKNEKNISVFDIFDMFSSSSLFVISSQRPQHMGGGMPPPYGGVRPGMHHSLAEQSRKRHAAQLEAQKKSQRYELSTNVYVLLGCIEYIGHVK